MAGTTPAPPRTLPPIFQEPGPNTTSTRAFHRVLPLYANTTTRHPRRRQKTCTQRAIPPPPHTLLYTWYI